MSAGAVVAVAVCAWLVGFGLAWLFVAGGTKPRTPKPCASWRPPQDVLDDAAAYYRAHEADDQIAELREIEAALLAKPTDTATQLMLSSISAHIGDLQCIADMEIGADDHDD